MKILKRKTRFALLKSAMVWAVLCSFWIHASYGQTTHLDDSPVIAQADELLNNRYTFPPHPTVELPADPSWSENPLNDNNWETQYHSLRFVRILSEAWKETHDRKYLDRAKFLLSDWYKDNPRSIPPSPYSWHNFSTAHRASVYAEATEFEPGKPTPKWLTTALLLHGETLADENFYVGKGNHALMQNLGLFDVARKLRRNDWLRLSVGRIEDLLSESVDRQGVTNEQAVFYQLYNYQGYKLAQGKLIAAGISPNELFARIDKMPELLAHATQPNGKYVMLGDTGYTPAKRIEGTIAEFAATQGKSGEKPGSRYALFDAGFALVRTGWGEKRPFVDETMLSARFGGATKLHGHFDGGSLTLYAYGAPLLMDSGKYSYNLSKYRTFFLSRSAHNLVVADQAVFDRKADTKLRSSTISPTLFELALTSKPYEGVTIDRRISFSRLQGYVVVDDIVSSDSTRAYRQLWHLREKSRPVTQGVRTWTQRKRGNVLIVQILKPSATHIVEGSTKPVQGWVSFKYNQKIAAPVVEAHKKGKSARFLTLLVPYETEKPTVKFSSVQLRKSGYEMLVNIDGKVDRLTIGDTGSSITPLNY